MRLVVSFLSALLLNEHDDCCWLERHREWNYMHSLSGNGSDFLFRNELGMVEGEQAIRPEFAKQAFISAARPPSAQASRR